MIPRFILLTIFSAFLFLITFIPMARLFSYFSLAHAWISSLIAVLIFPVGYLVANLFENKFTYYLVQFTNAWFAVILAVVSTTIIVELVVWLGKLQSPFTGWIIIGISALLIITSVVFGLVWHTKEIVIESDKVQEEVRFVQLSDVHAYGVRAPITIKKVFDRALALNPDFIVVTGDLVDVPGKPPADTFKVLDDVKIPLYYELGNHESYVGLEYVRELTKGTKLQLLENKAVSYKGISVVSVSDSTEKGYVGEVLPSIKRNESQFQVLLYHKPVDYLDAQKEGIDLMLSGHTHAGQFFPIPLLVRMMYKYPWGTHDVNGMTLHTSSGSGTTIWPLKIGGIEEITLIRLVPKK
ncbi:MAG: metallophosphoesterase [Nanoarchaeota archaeon]|nr:metallophosphoesterase [Nanoarchaeota archaeon]